MNEIIAFGAENKTCFSVLSEKGMYVSEMIDDLTSVRNFNKYEFSIKKYLSNKGIAPCCMVCDLHPDYYSSGLAEKLHAETAGSVLLKVQHHHAHIVSCMEDNGIEGEVIGISFDGTGYGNDGRSWGGEFMLCSKREFCRMFHLKYIPQPGGDKASREGWRMALAYLYDVFGTDIWTLDTPLLKRLEKVKLSMVIQMMDKEINAPLTSSMGRLFDAVSSLTGICDISSFEGEGAILLEKAASDDVGFGYAYDVRGEDICVSGMIREIVADISGGVAAGVISAKFHNTIADMIFSLSEEIYRMSGVKKVVVSGGCFLNRYIVDRIRKRFRSSNLEIYTHKKFSPSDLGLSVGQAVVAANM